ncbi:hypothetical protein ACFQ58_04760 [Agromyces sp. NPDC056523]|uniref:hypothetical protein n=1 Tax=Agromyces sp. NPDC056523 TaxID=3345850 RepID=UPI0036700D89
MIHELVIAQATDAPASSSAALWAIVLPALIAAVFGAVTGWLGAYLKVRGENFATKQEFEAALQRLAENTRVVGEENARIAHRASLDSDLRDAVRQFAVAAGGAIHSMAWLTWDCVERKRVDPQMVAAYDAEVHRLFPPIVAQLAVIGMIDAGVHGRLERFGDEIVELDANLSSTIVAEERDPGSQGDALRRHHEAASDLEERFRHGVAQLFPDHPGGARRATPPDDSAIS